MVKIWNQSSSYNIINEININKKKNRKWKEENRNRVRNDYKRYLLSSRNISLKTE